MPISPMSANKSSRMPSRPPMGGPQPQPGGDPVQGALAYGRRKAGLPVDFEQGHTTPSFDDGGVVPDPSAAPPPPQATDPQELLKYLSGDGALSPDVIMAMEAMADPDSSMDATDRMAAVLGKAPSPDVAFGVLQHHRTKYNGHTAAAKVAADKGDFAKAAMHANKAHESIPGSRRRFAPVPGGVHMTDGPAPQPQEEAFGEGGSVDSSNPNDETKDENSYADGGGVYADFPESNNIEDRRGERGEGVLPKPSKSVDPSLGNNQRLKDHDAYVRRPPAEGVVRKQPAFGNGGKIPFDIPALPGAPVDVPANSDRGARYDDYPDFPSSENIQDRRKERSPGKGDKLPPNGRPVDDRWGDFPHERTPPDKMEEDAGTEHAGREQSYDGGGPVEEDNTYGDFPPQADTAAVTNDEPSDDAGSAVSPDTSDDDLTTGSFQQLNSPRASRGDTQQDGEARMLSPEDLSRTMSLGYDAAVAAANKAKGDDLLSGKSYGQRIWDLMPSNGRTYKAPQGPPTGRGDTQQDEDSGEFPMQGPMPADGGPAAPAAGGATPEQGPADPDAGYKKDRQHANERRDEMMKWYEDQSRKLFPWASQEPQRQAFIMHGMERFFGQDLSRENNIRADKAGVAERGIQAKAIDNAETRRVREESNVRNNETKKQIAAFNQTEQGQRFQQGQIASTLRAGIMSGTVDINDPKAVAPLVKAFEQATGHKVDASNPDTIHEILGLNKSIVKPQGQQGGPINVGAQRINPNTGAVVTRQQDGTWK